MFAVRPLHPLFMAEVRGLDIRRPLDDAQVEFIERAIGQHAVLVFKDQPEDDAAYLAFAERFGDVHRSLTAGRKDMERRLDDDKLSDISNIDRDGSILSPDDMRRIQQRANLLWHTDNSFRYPAGRYTLLHARIVPPEAGETEFADARAAYDALPDDTKARIAPLRASHALANSRILAGTGHVFDEEELHRFPATEQPLVRRHEYSGRDAIYAGSHAEHIIGWPKDEGRALLEELIDHITQPRFVYRHKWEVGDMVMWDNRATLHRALPFDETRHRRDLRRIATKV